MASPKFQVNFTIQGTNRVRNQLRTIAALNRDLTDKVVGKHSKKESARLRAKAYPPKLPAQKYQRTGELGRRFRSQKVRAGVHRVMNRTQHAVWVVKKGMQNQKYHAGRWWTIEDTLQQNMPRLTRELSVELEKELDRG